jgi:tRNA modification GTPase
VRFIEPAALQAGLAAVAAQLESAERLLEAARPQRLRVTLLGLPNAGKSTLFNALLDAPRALVSDQPGTTRDVVSAELRLGDLPVILQDCAGVGTPLDAIDEAAQLRSARMAEQTDLLVWLHDGTRAWSAAETAFLDTAAAQTRLLLWTKADLGPRPLAAVPGFAAELRVSATDAASVAAVRRAIEELLAVVAPVALADVGLSRARQCVERGLAAAIAASLPELVAQDLREAIAGLAQHERAMTEAVLGRIYGRFCVGK